MLARCPLAAGVHTEHTYMGMGMGVGMGVQRCGGVSWGVGVRRLVHLVGYARGNI
jgi:hypothetical protein